MDTIRFPIQFTARGLAKVEEDSDEYYKQLLSLAILTEPGVAPLTPSFGIFDPTFRDVDKGQFVVQAARFVPEIAIQEINTELTDSGETNVSFTFRRKT